LGYLVVGGKRPSQVFAGMSLLTTILMVLVYVLVRGDLISLFEYIRGDVIGVSAAVVGGKAALVEEINIMYNLLIHFLPSVFVIYGLALLFIGWQVTVGIEIMLGRFVPSFGKYIYWKLPYYYIYIVGGLIAIRLVGHGWIRQMADNALLVLGLVLAIFGFAAIEYFFRRIKLTLFTKILFYVLFPPGLVIAVIVGIFDSYFDFRRVRARIIG
jgi:hypothetical protein